MGIKYTFGLKMYKRLPDFNNFLKCPCWVELGHSKKRYAHIYCIVQVR